MERNDQQISGLTKVAKNLNYAQPIMETVEQTADLEKKKEQLKAAMDNEKMLKAIQRYKEAHTPLVREYKKIRRNDPCPCGAKDENGKPIKYKNCCLKTGKYEGYKLISKNK